MRPVWLASLLVVSLVFGGGFAFGFPGGVFWDPVTREELALTTPRIDPEAGVEIVFRETEIDDSAQDVTRFHSYVRLKVYDTRGIAALDKIEITDAHDAPIVNLAARVIQPDGTVLDVPRRSIFAREVIRHGSERVRAKAFSFPGLVPGCVVEYQWEEHSTNGIGGLQLRFQDRFPAWRVRFRIKPFNYERRGFELVPAGFRYELPKLETDYEGFYTFEETSVPALHEEPWMPPDDMVQSWVMLYFLRSRQSPEQFWQRVGRDRAQEAARLARPTRAIQQEARRLIKDVADEAEQLRRLGRFCRDTITRAQPSPGALVREPGRGRRRLQTAEQTLKNRAGTPAEINLLFIALARAAGFDARIACVADRSRRMFRHPLPARFFLPDEVVAVRLNDAWQFFDPSNRDVAMGSLRWENEGLTALLCGRRKSVFLQVPRTPDHASRVNRVLRLEVAADGSAIGRLMLEHHGHCAADVRGRLAVSSVGTGSLAGLLAEIVRFEGAELDEILVQNLTEADAPLVVSAQVRVPRFAVRSEARLMFPLAPWHRGRPPVFTAARRQHAVYRNFGYTESDTVEVRLPPGWITDEVTKPAAFALPPALEYRAEVGDAPGADTLVFRRFVTQGGMLFPRSAYRLLKQAFDDLHRRDGQVAFARPRVTSAPRRGE